jgi:hypothetical protein
MAWNIRNYNAWLRAVRKEFGITQKQAQRAYRKASRRLNRPLRGVDVLRHPRITRDAAKGTPKRPTRGSRKRVAPRERKPPRHTVRIETEKEWDDLGYGDLDEELGVGIDTHKAGQ